MPQITHETAEGWEVAGAQKGLTSYRTWLFSGGWPRFDRWPAKNIHTDLETARSCGLPARGASGAMLEGYLTELMIELFGEQWLSQGVFSLVFTKIVGIGDEIVARAWVTARSREGPALRFDMDLWCENQRGETVAVGTGTGWTPSG